jgi:hypothetical protein
MTEAAAASAVEDLDKTLYWTLSLYVDAENLPADFKRTCHPRRQDEVQSDVFSSVRLRNAIEPMFNDIADRERLGVVEDYLLDVEGDHRGDVVEFIIDDVVEWSTEGKCFAAHIGPQKPRGLRVRRFWYVHVSGALSYHVSFSYRYAHKVDDFYFISLLQKLAAPKEFLRPKEHGRARFGPLSEPAGLFPLDTIKVSAAGGTQRFWSFVADCFNRDIAGLLGAVRPELSKSRADKTPVKPAGKSYFECMVRSEPFVETPHLFMPRARSMFVFDDELFVESLLPKSGSRTDKVIDGGCGQHAAAIREKSRGVADGGVVPLDANFLDSVSDEHLIYLFLAGFNQNIIDFINQEAHEVLDSLDPIYPLQPEHEAESFFVRYANPRAFISYVSKLRSLYHGNDYVGTCPYAFLIHVLAMHNEYMVRNYEEAADELVRETSGARLKRSDFHAAARRFHTFRKVDYANYYRFRANNVFRYDTEQEVFKKLEERRGTQARVDDVARTVGNVESFTADRESRERQFDATFFAWIGGVFVFCQSAFMLIDKADEVTKPGAESAAMSFWNFAVLSVGLAGAVIAGGAFIWWLSRRL